VIVRIQKIGGMEEWREYCFVMFKFPPRNPQLNHMRSKKYREAE